MARQFSSYGIDASELDKWLRELAEFIAIPSISADPERKGDVRLANDWVSQRIRRAGGQAVVEEFNGAPLTLGEIHASAEPGSAPTVLVYGHVDVQPPDPIELWVTPPFELQVRDGWAYGRGTADDKGQLFMLLEAVRRLATAGELPVNVRFACDGEEEIEGHTIGDWIAADQRGADVCLIYDSSMLNRETPTFAMGCRGLLYFHLRIRTGDRDLHSGQFGGAALNASHALTQTLAAVLPRDGQLPAPLRAGTQSPPSEHFGAVERRFPGEKVLNAQGATPAYATAAKDFYLRTTAEPSLDINGIASGSPYLVKTVLPVVAEANLSIRLAWGQDPAEIALALEELLRRAVPNGAKLELELLGSSAAAFQDPSATTVFELGQNAVEDVLGVRPLLMRGGGSIPIFPALVNRGIPTIITGFDVPEGNIHSPNERLAVDLLAAGIVTAESLLKRFGQIGRPAARAHTGR